jgi:cytochrome c oxidase subunit 1
LALFAIGGLTGVFLGALRTDVHLHDTYFVVAHFHYVMMGGTFIAFVGGLHHWWAKMTGKLYSELWGRVAAVMVFVGFNLTFFSQFILGINGMPRRYHSYHLVSPERLPVFQFWHQLSTAGSYLLAVGLFVILGYLLHSLFRGKPAPANPWNGKSFEWRTATPPIEHNFHEAPVCTEGPYEFDEIEGREAKKPA